MTEASFFRRLWMRTEPQGDRQRAQSMRFGLCGEGLEARLVLAGVEFEEHLFGEEERLVHAADVDGDADLDVISSTFPSEFSWHENFGGVLGEARGVTSSDPRTIYSVAPADVDGDGDIDVIVSTVEQRILWYENTDGMGTFGTERLVGGTSGWGPKPIIGTDLDLDGDVDVLSGSGGVVRWYENTDGNGNFVLAQLIPRWIGSMNDWALHAADLDGDGDVDALTTKFSAKDGGVIAWHENTDGAGTFGSPNIIVRMQEVFWSVDAADLDGDGDLDVISASESQPADHNVAWYKNTDGRGTFQRQQTIATFADPAVCVDAADMDGDGDNDLLSATWQPQVDRHDYGIAWHENTDGAGAFGEAQVITDDGGWCVEAADMDGDGDSDILSATVWYENLTDTNFLQPGDANEDRQFNQLDLVRVLQAGKYLTGKPANFAEGDWSNDGVFDQLDLILALATGNYLQGPYAAGASSLDRVLAANENVNEQVADDALIGDLGRMRTG